MNSPPVGNLPRWSISTGVPICRGPIIFGNVDGRAAYIDICRNRYDLSHGFRHGYFQSQHSTAPVVSLNPSTVYGNSTLTLAASGSTDADGMQSHMAFNGMKMVCFTLLR